jgi:hypothetical protein
MMFNLMSSVTTQEVEIKDVDVFVKLAGHLNAAIHRGGNPPHFIVTREALKVWIFDKDRMHQLPAWADDSFTRLIDLKCDRFEFWIHEPDDEDTDEIDETDEVPF